MTKPKQIKITPSPVLKLSDETESHMRRLTEEDQKMRIREMTDRLESERKKHNAYMTSARLANFVNCLIGLTQIGFMCVIAVLLHKL